MLNIWAIQQITKVPHAAEFVEGIINLRGKVIPVLDLRKRFELSSIEDSKSMRIIVVEIDGNVLGIMVDGVSEVLRISSDIVEPPPPAIANVNAEYLEGVAKLDEKLIILLNIDKVLTLKEKESLVEV